MTHDSRMHLKHYGAWTSDKDKKDSVVRAVGELARSADSFRMTGKIQK